MKRTRILICIVMVVVAWGAAELFAKELLADLGITRGVSIWLAVWAILLLSVARGLWNKVGSSALIGLLATAFKFAGPSTSYCHLLGIASIGLIFDLFATGLLRDGSTRFWRCALVGGAAAYGSRTFFVLYAIHVADLDHWVEGGWSLGLEHVLRGGSWVAAFAVLMAPLGFRLGRALAGSSAVAEGDHDRAESTAVGS